MEQLEIEKSTGTLLSLPYVARVKILSELTLSQQLILRRVCKTMKNWIDTSSLMGHIPVTVIKDHGSKTFTRFLEKRPPHVITQIWIQNDSCDLFDDPSLPEFLRYHSSGVLSLRVKRFFTCHNSNEFKFYESFTNLSELHLDKISIPTDKEVLSSFPKIFKNLKTLKIGAAEAFPMGSLAPSTHLKQMGIYAWNLIAFCDKLEYLGYPGTAKYFSQAFADDTGRGEFGIFCSYLQNRKESNPSTPNLKFCDFQNDTWPHDPRNVLPLLKMGNELGIKYYNVNANLLQYLKISSLIKMYDLPNHAGECIRSFKAFNCLVTECLPSIERISMQASDINTRLDYSCVFDGPKMFPNLKEIEIDIDVGISDYDPREDKYRRAREFRDLNNLLSHFFYDTDMLLSDEEDRAVRIYHSVTSLTIKFSDLPIPSKRKATPADLPLIWIANGLPNLLRLTMIGWDADQETCKAFWKGFPKLEELIIEDCSNITNICFTSECAPNIQRITVSNPEDNDYMSFESEDEVGLFKSEFLTGTQSAHVTWMK